MTAEGVTDMKNLKRGWAAPQCELAKNTFELLSQEFGAYK
mgnify:CR=1 FL=1|jgi:rubredoxin